MKRDIYSLKNKTIWIALIIILILFALSYLTFNRNYKITGLITSIHSTKEKLSQNLSYTDDINLDFNESTGYVYNWIIGNFCDLENCTLESVGISGIITANRSGNISIYLENLGKRYLIFNKSFELKKVTIPQNITTEENISFINETTNETITYIVNVIQEANFTIEQPEIFYFENNCSETCDISNEGFNQNSYKIIFDLNPNITLKIYNISYRWRQTIQQEDAVINRTINETIELNFSTDKIKEIKGTSLKAIAVRVEKMAESELWLFDLDANKQERIGFGESSPADFPIGIKDEFVFWLSKDFGTLFVYDTKNKNSFQSTVPIYDLARGERAEITIREIPWKIIVANEFYFYTTSTGEVFSDDDSAIREEFRKKHNIDLFLTQEELSNLKLEIRGEENEG